LEESSSDLLVTQAFVVKDKFGNKKQQKNKEQPKEDSKIEEPLG